MHNGFDLVKTQTKIKKQFVVTACLLMAVVLFCSILAFYWLSQSDLKKVKEQQNDSLLQASLVINKELSSVREIVRLLVADKALFKDKQSDRLNLTALSEHFSEFGSVINNISQIRWLDSQGQEQVRVNFNQGVPETVAIDALQNKRGRYYFRQGMASAAPDVYISRLDLNVEYGEIVEPFEPTIRASYRTSSDDYLLDGLIVVNFNLAKTFNLLKEMKTSAAKIQILNEAGQWLLHENPELEWAFMLDPKANKTTINPQHWQFIKRSEDKKILHFDQGQLFSVLKLNLQAEGSTSKNEAIYLLSKAEKQSINQVYRRAFMQAGMLFITLVLIGYFYLSNDIKLKLALLTISKQLIDEKEKLADLNVQLEERVQQLKLLQNDLVEAQKLSSLGMLAAGVAHEMNTPIGGAIMSISNAQLLSMDLAKKIDTGFSKQYLQNCLEQFEANLSLSRENLNKAAEHVKSFKRMAIERGDESKELFLFESLFIDLRRVLHPRFKNTRIELKTQVSIHNEIRAYPGVISRIIENLVLNALEHGFGEGEIGLIIVIAEQKRKDSVILRVQDTGRGIEQCQSEYIFDPFYTGARSKGHTGLGLFMVNQWVTKVLGGTLNLTKLEALPEGISTEFVIEFSITES